MALNVIDNECNGAYTTSYPHNVSSTGPSPTWSNSQNYTSGITVFALYNGKWTQFTSTASNSNVNPANPGLGYQDVWTEGCYCDLYANDVTLNCGTTTTTTTASPTTTTTTASPTTTSTTTASPTTTPPPPPPGGKGDPHITPFFGKEYTI